MTNRYCHRNHNMNDPMLRYFAVRNYKIMYIPWPQSTAINGSQLNTRRYFLKHLDEWLFKSPQPQSLVTGWEGFSSNDINYSCGLRNSAEIICYDFKEQAMDLIQDIDLWGNMDNFMVGVPRTFGVLESIGSDHWFHSTIMQGAKIDRVRSLHSIVLSCSVYIPYDWNIGVELGKPLHTWIHPK